MNEPLLGHLTKLLPFSLVDGPGNRLVLFLQGCNFDCVACHNPYTITECNGCGDCVDACPLSALSVSAGSMPIVDRETCDGCDICVQVCPYDSTPLSRFVTVDDVLEEIRPVAPFLSGVTVSGGEPTLQAEFIVALFDAIRSDPELGSLTTFIDSNGSAPPEVWDLLAPVTDGVMVDLKALDPDTHIELTGQTNGPVLDSIRYLNELGLLHEVRLLMMPGRNDSEELVRSTGRWLHRVNPDVPVKVIGFRHHGTRPRAADIAEPDQEQLALVRGQLEDHGLSDVIII